MTEWMNCNQSLPEPNTNKLFWVWGLDMTYVWDPLAPPTHIVGATPARYAGEWLSIDRGRDGKFYVIDDVTHWTPLPIPEPPT